MGRKLVVKKSPVAENQQWNPDEALAAALAEKAEFLLKHPKHRKYQADIDAILDKAGSSENRLTVLAMLMEGKLIELQQELKKLNGFLLRTAV